MQNNVSHLSLLVGIVGLVFFALAFFSFVDQQPTTSESDDLFVSKFQSDYAIYALDIPDTLYFAGELVPLYRHDVREALDRELLVNTYWQSQTLLFIKRANRHLPVIEPILREQGIPLDFAYLPLIESGLMNVVSPAGAAGFWQFLDGTARDYGLRVNKEVDERYHLEKATYAACDYLQNAYDEFGSWALVAAAYNAGKTRIRRILQTQQSDSYYDLHLNTETGRYVYRIIAAKMILENPAAYGFYYRKKDLYPLWSYSLLTVDSTIADLPAFASLQGISYRELKVYNPWLVSTSLTIRPGESYQIKIPVQNP